MGSGGFLGFGYNSHPYLNACDVFNGRYLLFYDKASTKECYIDFIAECFKTPSMLVAMSWLFHYASEWHCVFWLKHKSSICDHWVTTNLGSIGTQRQKSEFFTLALVESFLDKTIYMIYWYIHWVTHKKIEFTCNQCGEKVFPTHHEIALTMSLLE